MWPFQVQSYVWEAHLFATILALLTQPTFPLQILVVYFMSNKLPLLLHILIINVLIDVWLYAGLCSQSSYFWTLTFNWQLAHKNTHIKMIKGGGSKGSLKKTKNLNLDLLHLFSKFLTSNLNSQWQSMWFTIAKKRRKFQFQIKTQKCSNYSGTVHFVHLTLPRPLQH